jgi:hypothetical protein
LVVFGLSLAFALAALITMWGLQSEYRSLAPQLGMWSIPWIWLPLFFVAYFIPRGWQSIMIYLFAMNCTSLRCAGGAKFGFFCRFTRDSIHRILPE